MHVTLRMYLYGYVCVHMSTQINKVTDDHKLKSTDTILHKPAAIARQVEVCSLLYS